MRTVEATWQGSVPYQTAWEWQQAASEAVKGDPSAERLFLLTHPPVVTLGRGADPSHVLRSADDLQALGVDLVHTDRGGDVTYHGPGQIVGYPILDLTDARDVGRYLRDLEEVLIRTLRSFSIDADRLTGRTGVWVGSRKIAALGVRMSRWVTMHGFALNVDPIMEHFQYIVPCGIRDYGVTSMREVLESRRRSPRSGDTLNVSPDLPGTAPGPRSGDTLVGSSSLYDSGRPHVNVSPELVPRLSDLAVMIAEDFGHVFNRRMRYSNTAGCFQALKETALS